MKYEFYDINKDIHGFDYDINRRSFSPMSGAARSELGQLMVICVGYKSPFEGDYCQVKPRIPAEMLYKSRIVIVEMNGLLDVYKCSVDNIDDDLRHKKSRVLDGFFDGFFDGLVDEARQPGNILISDLCLFDPDSIIGAIKNCYAFRRSALLL